MGNGSEHSVVREQDPPVPPSSIGQSPKQLSLASTMSGGLKFEKSR